jgi:hypothetical protein
MATTANVRKVKPYSGFTKDTPDRLLLDAGAFFKNFDVGKDTYASAKAAGKCLGATMKGGEFSAKPNLRNLEIDGVHNRTKGTVLVDGWEAYIKATLIEITEDNLKNGLGLAEVEENAIDGYDKITGKDTVLDSDFIENITWVGNLLGESKPCIIQIYNGLNESGLTIAIADKDNGKFDAQFYGYNDASEYDDENPIEPPFAIYRPVETKEA